MNKLTSHHQRHNTHQKKEGKKKAYKILLHFYFLFFTIYPSISFLLVFVLVVVLMHFSSLSFDIFLFFLRRSSNYFLSSFAFCHCIRIFSVSLTSILNSLNWTTFFLAQRKMGVLHVIIAIIIKMFECMCE